MAFASVRMSGVRDASGCCLPFRFRPINQLGSRWSPRLPLLLRMSAGCRALSLDHSYAWLHAALAARPLLLRLGARYYCYCRRALLLPHPLRFPARGDRCAHGDHLCLRPLLRLVMEHLQLEVFGATYV
jgi:hypothetical protein